ncbi:MAG: hypothetical protein AUJ49_05205 [Desulfovibrionaceae bacterium CG1_02_65_16]|nr:MAG: hypothetical protein AUJ49_05205 [Desulfovibrionaceae bacterium CG1_02_65_16]
MNTLTFPLIRLFDRIQAFAESEWAHKLVGQGLVLFFLSSLALIELNSLGWLPDGLAQNVSLNRFDAVTQTFTLVLVLEVVELVFSLPRSTSRSVGKQFEILALILLRDAFKELTHLPVPIALTGHNDVLMNLAMDGAGALVVFVLLGAYKYAQRCAPRHWAPTILAKFITAKKLVALFVLFAFLFMGAYDALLLLRGEPTFDIFHDFYTLLIFTDILIVLIAQRYMPEFHAIFRNSGFALSTVFIRMALTADPMLAAIMGVGAMVFAVGLTYASNRFYAITQTGGPCLLPDSQK